MQWDFPEAFVDTNYAVIMTSLAGNPRIGTAQGKATDHIEVNGWATSGARIADDCDVVAIGRWL